MQFDRQECHSESESNDEDVDDGGGGNEKQHKFQKPKITPLDRHSVDSSDEEYEDSSTEADCIGNETTNCDEQTSHDYYLPLKTAQFACVEQMHCKCTASNIICAHNSNENSFNDCINDIQFSRSSVGGSKYFSNVQQNASVTTSGEDDLVFESRFESGNLAKAVKITPVYYELYLRPDLYTNKHTQWFYFRVTNTRKNVLYRFV